MGKQADGSPCILKRLIPGNFPRFGEPTTLLLPPPLAFRSRFAVLLLVPPRNLMKFKQRMGLTTTLTFTFRRHRQTERQTQRVEWSSTKGEAGQVSQHHVKVFDVFRTPEAATAADMENHISST